MWARRLLQWSTLAQGFPTDLAKCSWNCTVSEILLDQSSFLSPSLPSDKTSFSVCLPPPAPHFYPLQVLPLLHLFCTSNPVLVSASWRTQTNTGVKVRQGSNPTSATYIEPVFPRLWASVSSGVKQGSWNISSPRVLPALVYTRISLVRIHGVNVLGRWSSTQAFFRVAASAEPLTR